MCWNLTTAEQKEKSFNVSVINNFCESSFCAFANSLTSFTIIGPTNVGGMSMSKKNGDFANGLKKKW